MATKTRAKKVNAQKAMIESIQPLALTAVGFIAGGLAVNQLAKVTDKSGTAKGIKKALPALIVAGGAVFAGVKYGKTNAIVNPIAHGVAVAGVYKTAKALAPNSTLLAGAEDDLGGLSPISSATNPERWLVNPPTNVAVAGFPDLSGVDAPESHSGYYVDAPAYMFGTDDDAMYGADEYNTMQIGSGEVELSGADFEML